MEEKPMPCQGNSSVDLNFLDGMTMVNYVNHIEICKIVNIMTVMMEI